MNIYKKWNKDNRVELKVVVMKKVDSCHNKTCHVTSDPIDHLCTWQVSSRILLSCQHILQFVTASLSDLVYVVMDLLESASIESCIQIIDLLK